MNQNHFDTISRFESDLWAAADNLRANSKLTSSEYCMPVLGIIFLRHAANRYEVACQQIEADQVSGKMPKMNLAVHGLQGDIREANTFYEDVHQLRDGKPLEAAFDLIEDKLGARRNRTWKSWTLREDLTQYEDARQRAHNEFHQFDYFRHQLHWLFSRFPEAKFVPVPGLCKAVTRAEIAEADWSLTPGRYVGVALAEVDDDFDFGQTLRDIHTELADLKRDAVALAAKIQANFEGLGI